MPAPFWPNADLVEKALENNENWERDLKESWTIWSKQKEVKKSIEKISIERPINADNIEVWEWVPDEVLLHILLKNYKVQDPYYIRCVDDRTPENLKYWIYWAGWSQGFLKNFFSVLNNYNKSYKEEEIRKLFVEMIWWEENYYCHSDEHNINKKWACGCDTMSLALNKEHVPNLTDSNKRFFAKERKEKTDQMEVLQWNHNAKWIILIDDEEISIVPKRNEEWFFIYNQKILENLIKDFVAKINKNTNLELDEEAVCTELYKETLSTFWSLWNELPHYRLKKKWDKYYLESDGLVKDVVKHYYMKD